MRNVILVVIVGTLLGIAISGWGYRTSLYAQFPPVQMEGDVRSGELIALSSDKAEGHQQVTVIDPKSRVMSVYHIDFADGTITLKSVRNIQADLLMDEYNTDSPLPREIRAILKQR